MVTNMDPIPLKERTLESATFHPIVNFIGAANCKSKYQYTRKNSTTSSKNAYKMETSKFQPFHQFSLPREFLYREFVKFG